MDCSPPGSSVHGIFQARALERVAISFSSGSSGLRDWTQVSHFAGRLYQLSHQGRPEQGRRRWTKNYKDCHSIRIKKKMVRKGRRNRKKHSWSSWSDVLGRSSLPRCGLLLFLVSLIFRSSAFAQNQIASRAFFSCEILCIQVVTPCNSTVMIEVQNTPWGPFQETHKFQGIFNLPLWIYV